MLVVERDEGGDDGYTNGDTSMIVFASVGITVLVAFIVVFSLYAAKAIK